MAFTHTTRVRVPVREFLFSVHPFTPYTCRSTRTVLKIPRQSFVNRYRIQPGTLSKEGLSMSIVGWVQCDVERRVVPTVTHQIYIIAAETVMDSSR